MQNDIRQLIKLQSAIIHELNMISDQSTICSTTAMAYPNKSDCNLNYHHKDLWQLTIKQE